MIQVIDHYRTTTGAGPPAADHDHTLLNRWCDRTVHWNDRAESER
ncbi:hypothetical protein [Streptomyces bullii]|uniref:Uncharacterized protein n=1 Tax=Streptomyces bullii TaxID=349910 RepID=A0ABW0UM66_9ACTN